MSAESLTGNGVADTVIGGLILAGIMVGITIAIRKLKGRKKKPDFYAKVIKRKKPESEKSFNDKYGNVNEKEVPEDLSPITKDMPPLVKRVIFAEHLKDPIKAWDKYSREKTLPCGCKAKGKQIIALCGMHVGSATFPDGYFW